MQNLVTREVIGDSIYTKYSDGIMEIVGIRVFQKPAGDINRFTASLIFAKSFTDSNYYVTLSGHGGNSGLTNIVVNHDNPVAFSPSGFGVTFIQAQPNLPFDSGVYLTYKVVGRWK
ncbi:hypothetical protein HS141_06050 [Cetobacterium somerae]|uniref:hypothetical protein n=1 Tax=Cetobacterium somerae TaxID=188913 RepID=UPI00211EDFCA|nr:hypothetical protein [Cetobacterium somerae]MCQ9626533.1 hypothetical protein [Cetobacterium somerae]